MVPTEGAGMKRSRDRLLSTVVALAAGGVGYALAGDPMLALALGLVYGVGAWLAVAYYGALPESVRGGTNWDVAKWNGIWVGALTFGGFAAMYTSGVPLAVGFALALVVYGVSGLGYFVAVAQMTEAGSGSADSGTAVERRAEVERSEAGASR